MPQLLNPLRVLVVAADQLSRAGLAALLAQQSGVEVAGQAAEEDDLDSVLEVYGPDVLVWDLGWKPVGSLARLSELRETAPPVVALLADDSVTAQARAAGARGILLRDSNIEIWSPPWEPLPGDLLCRTRAWPRQQPPFRSLPLVLFPN